MKERQSSNRDTRLPTVEIPPPTEPRQKKLCADSNSGIVNRTYSKNREQRKHTISTTEMYTHVIIRGGKGVLSPMDALAPVQSTDHQILERRRVYLIEHKKRGATRPKCREQLKKLDKVKRPAAEPRPIPDESGRFSTYARDLPGTRLFLD